MLKFEITLVGDDGSTLMELPKQYGLFETAIGDCGLAWTLPSDSHRAPAVALFRFPEASSGATEKRLARRCGTAQSSSPPMAIARIIERVRRHLAGDIEDFCDVPVELSGIGSFAQSVYGAARKIPSGQTMTYGQLAQAIDRPGTARAVGQALGSNPIPLIIPCHRVLAAGGKPGGFSAPGGLTTKRRLLQIESVCLFT